MRGLGQIAELCEIAEPDVAAITNVGPVHLELLGTLEAIAEAKAEILGGLGDQAAARWSRPTPRRSSRTCADELRDDHLRRRRRRVRPRRRSAAATDRGARSCTPAGEAELRVPVRRGATTSPTRPARSRSASRSARRSSEMARRAPGISFSRLRGELVELPGGVGARQRLLQRQPDLDAARRSTTSPRSTPAGAADRGARRHGRARPRRARAITARPAPTPASSGSTPIVGVGELARDYAPDEWAPDPEAGGRRSSPGCSATATRSWSRARARSGSRRSPTSSCALVGDGAR